jgi:cyclopropane-fatty-acyl-phospholipid synthase
MQVLLDWIGRGFRGGTLEFSAPDGRVWQLGRGKPVVRLRLRSATVLPRMLLHPALKFGEAYVDGDWQPQDCSLSEVLGVATRFADWHEQRRGHRRLRRLLGRLGEINSARRSRRIVAHHYNLDAAFYRLFLDREMHYSCAYFADPKMTLEQAQEAKSELIARKLDLRREARVLDIGCSWGALALHLARHHGAHVTGITLSPPQFETARQRAAQAGLQNQVQVRLADYREVQGQYDAVVSVGMFEHVGRPQYARYFEHVRRLLKPDGVALIHSIGRLGPPGATNPWIRRYIFPGSYIPAASEVLSACEDSGLVLNDLEVWRLHYAQTLAEWHRRFQAARERVLAMPGLDERFCRLWSFYLQASEASFRAGSLGVFQLQLTRSLQRLPLTRDYLYGHARAGGLRLVQRA